MKISVVFLLCFVAFSPALFAQTTGSMRGVVSDEEGKPVPGATVIISSSALIGQTRTAYTNELGVFRFPSLPVGTYSVEVSMEGFQKVRVERVDVSLEGTANVPLTMKMASVAEAMTIIGETPLIDVTEPGFSNSFKDELLEEVPTKRSFTDLMQQSPGVSSSEGDSNTDRTIAFGSNQQSNAWMVDGMDTTAPETGATWLAQTPENVEEIQVMGVGAPAEYGNHMGAVFNVVTKKGGNTVHGGANYFFQTDALTDANVTQTNNICDAGDDCEHFNRDRFSNVTAQLGGPIKKDQVWFFGSFEYVRDASTEPGVPPEIATENKADRYDIKLTSRLGEKHEMSGFYHLENWVSPDQATPFIAPGAVYQERGRDHGWGGRLTSTLSNNLLFEAGYAGWTTHDFHDSPTGSLEPYFIEYSPPGGGPYLYSGGTYYPFDYVTSRHQVNGKVTYYAEDFLKSQHEFRFGVQYSRGLADTKATAAGVDGFYAYHYAYDYYGTIYDYFYRAYQLPFQYGAVTKDLGIFLDDTITVNDRLTLNLGVRFDHNTGDIPEFERLAVGTPSFSPVGNFVKTGETFPEVHVMTWNRVSPRLGFVFQPRGDGKSIIQGSFGIYYDHNVSGNWDFPSPSVTPFQIYQCTANCSPTTGTYDELTYELTWPLAFDPDIRPPRTLQYAVGFEQQVGDSVSFGTQYIYKDTKDLIGWSIIGGEWEPITYTDPFTGTQYTLLSQVSAPTLRKGNAPFPEGIPEFSGNQPPYFQKYHGLIFTFNKRFSDNWALNASYTWSRSTGLIPRVLTQRQFNPFYGSLGGTDPNSWINAEGRLQGDRPHMLRVQAVFFKLPGGLQASTAIDFSSGRSHTRQIRVRSSDGLAQGGTDVIMERGFRLSPIENVDVTVAKLFPLSEDVHLRIEGTIYNLLNSDNELNLADLRLAAGEEFVPDVWMQPRRLSLRVGLQF